MHQQASRAAGGSHTVEQIDLQDGSTQSCVTNTQSADECCRRQVEDAAGIAMETWMEAGLRMDEADL